MECNRLKPLPVTVPVHNDESGLSILYRALVANGLSFRDTLHWLKLRSWTSLYSSEVEALAWITGLDSAWLSHRTFTLFGRQPFRRYTFMAHGFCEGAANVTHFGRLCPICVKHKRYGKASWLLRFVCGCSEHNTIFLERCPRCQRTVNWNRPAIDICSCGHFLTAASSLPTLPGNLLPWLMWVETRLNDVDAIAPASEFGLHPVLDALSLDGASRLLIALGLLSTLASGESRLAIAEEIRLKHRKAI